MRKSLKISLLAAALATSGMAHAEDVKIAFLGGFTGPLESLTPPIYDGVKLAIDNFFNGLKHRADSPEIWLGLGEAFMLA